MEARTVSPDEREALHQERVALSAELHHARRELVEQRTDAVLKLIDQLGSAAYI